MTEANEEYKMPMDLDAIGGSCIKPELTVLGLIPPHKKLPVSGAEPIQAG